MKLNQKKINSFCLILILFVGCSKEENKASHKTDVKAEINNQILLLKSEVDSIAKLVNFNKKSQFELTQDIITDELLLSEAVSDSLYHNEEFNDLIYKSYKNLLITYYLQKKIYSKNEDINEFEFRNFFNDNLNNFRFNEDKYIISYAVFNKRKTAAEFRSSLFDDDWNSALSKFNNELAEFKTNFLIEDELILPGKIKKILELLQNNEVSIVLEAENKFYIVQKIDELKRLSIPEYKYVREIVKSRYHLYEKSKQYNQLINDLYSKYNVKIYQD